MIPATEFRRHAAECTRMAREAGDKKTKATWKGLAQRWLVCAELAEKAARTIREAPHGAKHIARTSKRFAH